jgi:hypothetical protein
MIVYIYSYYLFFNTYGLILTGRIPHNAFIACLGIILFVNTYYSLLYKHHRFIINILMILFLVFLIVMPILAVLRGASLTLVAIIIVLLLSSRRKFTSRVIVLTFGVVLALFILTSDSIVTYFNESQHYGYVRPSDMISVLGESDPNKEVRINWWKDVLLSGKGTALFGTAFNYTFDPFNRGESSSDMLHNYYMSMLVDGGLLLLLLYTSLIVLAFRKAINVLGKGSDISVKYVCWNIALISTYSTNAYGHRWDTAVAMSLLQAYSILRIYSRNTNY